MPRLDLFLFGQQGFAVHFEMLLRVEGVTFQTRGVFRTVTFRTAFLTLDVDILRALRLGSVMAPPALIDVMRIVIELGLGEPVGRDLRLDDPPSGEIVAGLLGLMTFRTDPIFEGPLAHGLGVLIQGVVTRIEVDTPATDQLPRKRPLTVRMIRWQIDQGSPGAFGVKVLEESKDIFRLAMR